MQSFFLLYELFVLELVFMKLSLLVKSNLKKDFMSFHSSYNTYNPSYNYGLYIFSNKNNESYKQKLIMIKINQIKKEYKNFTLDIQNINIDKGARIAIAGKNGSGKTTFVESLLGLVKANKFSVEWNKEGISDECSIPRFNIFQ